eukprot:gb/GFBE01073137.1/.p1 GENE.gb/GFBE01073137.1/~~gb/GFBE01073137.1/.p1  ORF type:complete len:344 (+),score=60.24 gb/GFBE01073137.1/:1-1032(+)
MSRGLKSRGQVAILLCFAVCMLGDCSRVASSTEVAAEIEGEKPTADYYSVLGVEPSASPTQIKKAYHKLAMKHHPDKNFEEGATERFQLIAEAFNVLSDPAQKVSYDLERRTAAAANAGRTHGTRPAAGGGYPSSTHGTRPPPRRYTTRRPQTATNKPYGAGGPVPGKGPRAGSAKPFDMMSTLRMYNNFNAYRNGEMKARCPKGQHCFKGDSEYPGCGATTSEIIPLQCKDCQCKPFAQEKCGDTHMYCAKGAECTSTMGMFQHCQCKKHFFRDELGSKDVNIFSCHSHRCCRSMHSDEGPEYRWFALEDLMDNWGKKVCPVIDGVKWTHASIDELCGPLPK